MKAVKIVWLDATSISEQINEQQIKDACAVKRTNWGVIKDETENDITLAFGILEFNPIEYKFAITIPKGCIEEIIELQEVKHD
jgi:hypothetical protein